MPQINVIKLAGDFVILGALVIPVLLYKSYSEPPHNGFFCNDESIRYPFVHSTVSTTVLFILSFILPILLIATIEASEVCIWEKKYSFETTYFLNNFFVHRYFIRLYAFIGYFVLGLIFSVLTTDTAKFTAGSLRPNFIAVCRPNIGWLNCTEPYEYIADYKCTNPNYEEVSDTRRSFYSGHSATIFYAAVYLIMYVRARMSRPVYQRTITVPVLQFVFLTVAVYVCCTRLSDHKHHLCDVLVGALMGSLIAYITGMHLCKIFERHAKIRLGATSKSEKTAPPDDIEETAVTGRTALRGRSSSLPGLPLSKPDFLRLDGHRSDLGTPIQDTAHKDVLVY